MNTAPAFAVVGHPNKGKSAIVSALAMDDSVAVSDVPGTTKHHTAYPFEVDGERLYTLIDTPGFQRPAEVLEILQKEPYPADKRPEAVRAFVHRYKDNPRFADEIELLTPIVEGAGIIYVVDGSKPYGSEYEAEMEILRWTGQPSMALINRIDESDFTEAWRRALSGYFHIIRTFDPMLAHFGQHLALLESMAQMDERWTPSIKRSIESFVAYRKRQIVHSAETIADTVATALCHTESAAIASERPTESEKEKLLRRYKEALRGMERHAKKKIEALWNHTRLQKEEDTLVLEDYDLFSEKSAELFGLTRKEIVAAGAVTGGISGAGIDLLFLGHTLFLGGIVGAIGGGAAAYFAFEKLSDIEILGRKLGSYTMRTGPVKSRNFPYVLLNRLLYHTMRIATLSHAKRETLHLDPDTRFAERYLDESDRKAIEKLHRTMQKCDEEAQKAREAYAERLKAVLERELLT